MSDDESSLIEQVASAYRERNGRGELRPHPAFADLDAAGREQAYALAGDQRRLEAALDAQGLSSTGQQVIQRILGARARP